jgi:hypothetical protein
LSEAIPAATIPVVHTPPPAPPPTHPKTRFTPEGLQSLLKKNVKKVAPDAEPVVGPKSLNIVVTGAVEKTLTMTTDKVPWIPNVYTPALSKSIASNPQIKALMDNGVIFDGKPTVSGDNIYIKTRLLQEQVNKTMGGLAGISKIAQTVSSGGEKNFPKPEKLYDNSFATDDFAITHSPFDGPVLLRGEDDEGSTDQEDGS